MTRPPPHARAAGPLTLRVSVTDRCQLRCLYCTPAEGVALFAHEQILRHEEIVEVVRVLARHFGLTKVRITGGEPLVRRGVADLVAMLAAEPAGELAMTTNGLRLPELAGELKRAGLTRINISLDSLDAATYRTLTRGGELSGALAGIDAAVAAGLTPVKLNATLLRGVNDSEAEALTEFALGRGLTMRFIELMPIGEARARFDEWFVPAREVIERLARLFELTELPRRPGSASREFHLAAPDGRTGAVGVISSFSQPFCGDCARLRLTATGELIGCLAKSEGLPVTPLLRRPGGPDGPAIAAAARAVLATKRTGCGFWNDRNMVKVGG